MGRPAAGYDRSSLGNRSDGYGVRVGSRLAPWVGPLSIQILPIRKSLCKTERSYKARRCALSAQPRRTIAFEAPSSPQEGFYEQLQAETLAAARALRFEVSAFQTRVDGVCAALEALEALQAKVADAPDNDRQARRRAVVLPLLDAMRMTPTSWARKAKRDPSVAFDYLAGQRKTRRDTRAALAAAIGLTADALPD